MLIDAREPGVVSASLHSSLTFAAVSHPQKKKTAERRPVGETVEVVQLASGLNQLQRRPAGRPDGRRSTLTDRPDAKANDDEVLDDQRGSTGSSR